MNERRPRAYLAGAMERAPDRGRAWRQAIVAVLDEIGHGWFNPCEEELVVVSDEERANLGSWKADGHENFQRTMRRIIEHDLGALESSDYVICYWDEHTHGSGGTPSELTLARMWEKPVYLVLAIDRMDVSSWVLGCASRTFESLDHLAAFLREEHGS